MTSACLGRFEQLTFENPVCPSVHKVASASVPNPSGDTTIRPRSPLSEASNGTRRNPKYMKRKFAPTTTLPTLSFLENVLTTPGYTFEMAVPWHDTGSMTLLAEGNSLKDGSGVLAKIAPSHSNASMCLEREAHILSKLTAYPNASLSLIDIFHIDRENGDVLVLLLSHPGSNVLGRFFPSGRINDLLLPVNISSPSRPIVGPLDVGVAAASTALSRAAEAEAAATELDFEAVDVMDLASFIQFAIEATHCLEQVHKANFSHREIRANAFHMNAHSGHVRFVHFGNRAISLENFGSPSSLVLRAHPLERWRVKEALCYLAPEQTGSIETVAQDHRTDLYSLGILFWTLLVGKGQLPFDGETPELLHQIVQKRPMPPHEVRRDVPQVVASIVDKLLAKNPDHRYQSAYGLKMDLLECQRRLQAAVISSSTEAELILPFEIGKEDRFTEFTFPLHLFGREKELETIRNVIRQVATSYSRAHSWTTSSVPLSTHTEASTNAGDDLSDSAMSESSMRVGTSVGAVSYEPSRPSPDGSIAMHRISRSTSRTHTIVVCGPPGVGKSSIVLANQANWRSHGLWGQAKFQNAQSAPFAAMLTCLSAVLRQLQVFSTSLETFVSLLRERLGPQLHNVPLLYHGAPELREVLAQFNIMLDAPHEALDTLELRNRFQVLVENVFAVIAETRLFALFLDDIHEADESTLDLITTLINSKSRMLIFITLRSDKEQAVCKVKSMFSARARPTWLDVGPLTYSATLSMVSMALHQSEEDCEPLVRFIHSSSSGIAFATRNFLTTLQRHNLVTFDWDSNVWKYNMATIERSFEENFVSTNPNDLSFLVTRLRELPQEGRQYLRWASQIGQTFKVTDVGFMIDWETRRGNDEESDLHSVIDFQRLKTHVSEEGAGGRTSIRGLQIALTEGWLVQRARDMCSFAHDRYWQAAQAEAAKLPEEVLARMSFRIIMMTLHDPSPDIYRIAEHAKKCLRILQNHPKREEFLATLIEAGESAWARGAHELAIDIFQNAAALLPNDAWKQNQQRTFSLYTKIAELLTWAGNYSQSDEVIRDCLDHVKSREDKCLTLRLRSQNHSGRNNFSEALDDLLSALRLLGVDVNLSISPAEADIMFEQIKQQLLAKGSEEVLAAPRTTDPKVELAFTLLNDAGLSAYWNPSSPNFADIIGLTTIQLALKAGMAPGTAMGFFWALGAAAERHGLLRFAQDLGEMGLHIAERAGTSAERCRARVLRCTMVSAYTNVHIRSIIPTLEEAIQYGQSAGDRLFTALARIHLIETKLYVGEHLGEIVTAAEECVSDVQATLPGTATAIPAQALLNCIRALGGYTTCTAVDNVFDTDTFSDSDYVREVTSRSGSSDLTTSWYNAFKIPALYCLGFPEAAAELGFEVYVHRDRHPNHRHLRYALFFHSLALLATLRKGILPQDLAQKYLMQVHTNQAFIGRWLHSSPINTNAWIILVEAELASLRNSTSATRLFDEAVTAAVNNEWLLEEACALLLQGSHFIRIGVKTLGAELQSRSLARFGQFGARGVVNRLSSSIMSDLQRLKRPILSCDVGIQTDVPVLSSFSGDSYEEAPIEDEEMALTASELSQILKWSKDISRDITLASALQRLTEIVTETSHSEMTCVVVARESGEYTVATTHTPPERCQVFDLPKPVRLISDPLQKAIIDHTLNSKELYRGDVTLDLRFSSEATQSTHKFVICLPIFSNRGQTIGACYMTSQYPFPDKALTILTLLCQQASISISNAILFRSVQAGTKDNLKMIAAQREALEEARRSREDALKATKIKSNFLASMSHELRTPFSSFYGFLDLLNGTDLNQGQEELVQTAKQSCELLLKIIDSILDYSKLEASAVTLEKTPFAMEDMIADCMELLLPMAAIKLDLSFNIESNVPPWVIGDYARIRQVLMNLIGNAVKFTEKGAVSVVCSVDRAATDAVWMKLSISDTGVGIADIDLLFKPFQQADNSTTRQFGGTGLGLSISRELVELMGGSIGCESRLGVGSTFWFIIPLTPYKGELAQKSQEKISSMHAKLLNRHPRLSGIICSRSELTRSLLQNLLSAFRIVSVASIDEIDQKLSLLSPSENLDFLILDEESEANVSTLARAMHASVKKAIQDTKIIHLFTPATDRKFTSEVPGVVKLTKPPRSLKLLQVLSTGEGDVPEVPRPRRVVKKSTEVPHRTLYGNVLIAEDNIVAQTLLVKQLSQYSLKVFPTNNGEAAIREWEAHAPGYFSVALFDHHMPICDGVEATKRLRQLEKQLKVPMNLPIVALSADAQQSTKQLCLSAGMNAFFTKPLKKDDLHSLLSMFGPQLPPGTG